MKESVLLENKLWQQFNKEYGYKNWNPVKEIGLSNYIYYAEYNHINTLGFNLLLGYIKENILELFDLSNYAKLKIKCLAHIDDTTKSNINYLCDKVISSLDNFKESIEKCKTDINSFILESAYSYLLSNKITINFCGGIVEYYTSLFNTIKKLFENPNKLNINKAVKILNNEEIIKLEIII